VRTRRRPRLPHGGRLRPTAMGESRGLAGGDVPAAGLPGILRGAPGSPAPGTALARGSEIGARRAPVRESPGMGEPRAPGWESPGMGEPRAPGWESPGLRDGRAPSPGTGELRDGRALGSGM